MWETGWQGHYKEGAKPGRNAYYYTTFTVLQQFVLLSENEFLFTFVQITKSDKSK